MTKGHPDGVSLDMFAGDGYLGVLCMDQSTCLFPARDGWPKVKVYLRGEEARLLGLQLHMRRVVRRVWVARPHIALYL